MTDEPTPDSTDETTQPTEVYKVNGDEILDALARLAHTTGAEIGLSVTVAGALLSGRLVARNKWLDRVADHYGREGGYGAVMLEQLRNTFRMPDDQDVDRYGFLHLLDVTLLTGDNAGAPSGHWRVNIAEVTSWSFTTILRG